MALLFIEGFEPYGGSVAEMTKGAYLDTTNISFSTFSRTGTYSLVTAGVQNAQVRRSLYGEYTTLGMGFAFYITEYPVESTTARLCEFNNDNNSPQVSVWITTAGNISIGRGAADVGQSYTEFARTTNSPCITDAWQHVEIQIHFHDTAGWFEIRLDGITVLQGSNLDTLYSTTYQNCNQVNGMGTRAVISGGSMNWQQYMDDWYVYDMTGSENNNWIGDRRVLALVPVDNGGTQEWTPNGASTEYQCIDEIPADDDTTYISAGPSGLPINSTFQLTQLGSDVASINGIEIYTKSKKSDAGVCNLQVSMQQGSDEATGEIWPASTAYTHRTQMFELDPSTGALWTPAGLNSALVDIERTA